MLRRLYIFATTLCLLACAVVIVFWIRSYLFPYTYRYGPSRLQMTTFTFANGLLEWTGPHETAPQEETRWSCWQIAFLTLVVPSLPYMLRLRRRIRLWYAARQRASTGLCPICGYDLRATPTRCPECGTQFPSAPSQPQGSPAHETSTTAP